MREIKGLRETRYLYIDDLVYNLLYTLKSNGIDTNKVSYNLISEYVMVLRKKFYELDVHIQFLFSSKDTENFLELNNGLFIDVDNKYIQVTRDLSLEELNERIDSELSYEVTYAILDEEVIETIIDAYENELNEQLKPKTKKFKNI